MNLGLGEFHFLRPLWLLMLLALPFLHVFLRRRRHASDPWRAACDPELLQFLRADGAVRNSRLPVALLTTGLVLATLALAGPAWRQLPQPLLRSDAALVIALDLSDRMRAADLKPDRLSRARFKLMDLIASRTEGQTALIGYAGDAFTVAPLTDDARSLSDLLAALAPETMPVRGQRAERAITLGARLVRDAGFAQGDLLLVTDRVAPLAVDAAREAHAGGLRISVLGVGTAQGAPVTLAQGGFAKDEQGDLLLPRLEEAGLRTLADAGGGRYVTLDIGPADLAALDLGAISREAEANSTDRSRSSYQDEGPWLLLVLLPVAAMAFRRGWLAAWAFGLALALPPVPARAISWDALWRREDQRAWEALRSGDAQTAARIAQDPALRGSAAFRQGDFARAESEFSRGTDADANYNRGNALAGAQRYEDALAAFDEALRLDPGHEDARANRAAVQEWLQQQPPPASQNPQGAQGESSQEPSADEASSQPGEPSSSDDAGQRGGDPQDGPAQDRKGGESGVDEAQTPQEEGAGEQQRAAAEQEFSEQMQRALEQPGEKAEPSSEPSTDPREAERQQAVEQWLRRVPDDPGGLLRRKFALEYQRRLREAGGEEP